VAMPGSTEVSVLLTRLYAPSGDFAEPAYAARTSHRAALMKCEAMTFGCIEHVGDCGDNAIIEPAKLQAVPCWARFAGGSAYSPEASASAPIPDTTNTEARAPSCRPRPAGDDPRSGDRSHGSSRSPGRTRRATAFQQSARRGWWVTTACRGRWPGADSSDR
jgi:hypothetical protein